jgi:hypothetical protein
LDALSNSSPAVRLYSERREINPKTLTGDSHATVFGCSYLPDDYDPSVETEETIEHIHALNREMIAAGVRKFAFGLSPARDAKTLRKQPDGKVLVTDGRTSFSLPPRLCAKRNG